MAASVRGHDSDVYVDRFTAPVLEIYVRPPVVLMSFAVLLDVGRHTCHCRDAACEIVAEGIVPACDTTADFV